MTTADKKKITVIGATNTDIAGECLFPMVLSDSNIGKVSVSLGGVGHNIALSAALLGASVSFITAFGSDQFGKIAVSSLEDKMDISSSLFSKGRSGVYLFVTDHRGEMHVAVNDMSVTDEITPLFIEARRSLISSSPIVVLDANLSEETILEASSMAGGLVVAEAVSTLKASRIIPSFNNIDILKSNRMELEFLSGVGAKDDKSIRKAAMVLIDKGVKSVLVTSGTCGSYYVSRERFIRSGIREVDVATTNGAGDSFLGGFVAAMGEGMDIPEAMRIASASASLAVSSLETVPSCMNMKMARELAKEIEIEELS